MSAVILALTLPLPAFAQQNIIVFVADGLRAAAVSPSVRRLSPRCAKRG
jgi:hypothetical protein